MNINPTIIAALASLSMPVAPNVYDGQADEYITFNYADERPEIYANDTDISDATYVQVHYFTRSDPQINKKAIRRLLRAAGFTIYDTSEIYESDTKFTHVIVSAWIEGEVDDS